MARGFKNPSWTEFRRCSPLHRSKRAQLALQRSFIRIRTADENSFARLDLVVGAFAGMAATKTDTLPNRENRIPAGSDAKRGVLSIATLSHDERSADIIELPGEFARRAVGDRFEVSGVLPVALSLSPSFLSFHLGLLRAEPDPPRTISLSLSLLLGEKTQRERERERERERREGRRKGEFIIDLTLFDLPLSPSLSLSHATTRLYESSTWKIELKPSLSLARPQQRRRQFDSPHIRDGKVSGRRDSPSRRSRVTS